MSVWNERKRMLLGKILDDSINENEKIMLIVKVINILRSEVVSASGYESAVPDLIPGPGSRRKPPQVKHPPFRFGP